jgi:hypothetical protein
MSRPLVFAVGIAILGLGACNPTSGPASGKLKPPARLPTPEAPALWSIETQGAGQAHKIVEICADAQVRRSFSQSVPEANGKPCRLVGRQPVQKDELFATRCRIGDDLFTVHAVSTGDVDRDFVVDTTIETDTRGPLRFEQTLHFRKLSDRCPAGWAVGDSGSPGDQRLVNATSGAVRPLSTPIPAP